MSIVDRIRKAKRVYLIGNGGSYANASHIANDLLSVGIKAYTMDPAILTAFANDYGYEHAFKRWIGIVGEKDDMLICLSGSGKSPNILNAIQIGNSIGMDVLLVSCFLTDKDMQQSEEQQIIDGHSWMKGLQ